MKLQIVDEAGNVFAERAIAMTANVLPDEYLEAVSQNARLVEGNKKLLLGLIGTLQDAKVLHSEGLNEDVLDMQVGAATGMKLFEKHATGTKLGAMGAVIVQVGKQLAGKAQPVDLDIEYLGELMQKFGNDNAVLIPGIGEYMALVTDQLRAKFGKNGK